MTAMPVSNSLYPSLSSLSHTSSIPHSRTPSLPIYLLASLCRNITSQNESPCNLCCLLLVGVCVQTVELLSQLADHLEPEGAWHEAECNDMK